eukprot:COSAG06_NODE_26015_length_623_cov_2.291985_2_plen_97_part_01
MSMYSTPTRARSPRRYGGSPLATEPDYLNRTPGGTIIDRRTFTRDVPVTCPLSQAGHCAARGSRAHHRADQLADWPRSAVRFPIICSNHELSYTLLA